MAIRQATELFNLSPAGQIWTQDPARPSIFTASLKSPWNNNVNRYREKKQNGTIGTLAFDPDFVTKLQAGNLNAIAEDAVGISADGLTLYRKSADSTPTRPVDDIQFDDGVYPTNFTLLMGDSSIVTTPPLTRIDAPSFETGSAYYVDPPALAVGNSFKLTKSLAAGNYRLRCVGARNNGYGQQEVRVNNTVVGTFDWYAPVPPESSQFKVSQTLNFTVADGGEQEIKFTITGKNAASSGMNFTLEYLEVTPF